MSFVDRHARVAFGERRPGDAGVEGGVGLLLGPGRDREEQTEQRREEDTSLHADKHTPADRAGKDADTRFMFHLTITADDLDRFIADPRHTARADGWSDRDRAGRE